MFSVFYKKVMTMFWSGGDMNSEAQVVEDYTKLDMRN